MLFHVAGPVCGGVGVVPSNVRLHARATPDLLGEARLGLSPVSELMGGNDRVVDFSRAGLPVIASPEASRGFRPELAECWLVVAPEPGALRDAIVESVEWDWSAPVSRARSLVAEDPAPPRVPLAG
jgi:hypothetical protein